MKSIGYYMIEVKAEVDETGAGEEETGVKGRKNNKKKLVVFAIKRKGKGVGRT